MGGTAYGCRGRRVTTDDCVRIRLPDLRRLGMLQRHCMMRQSLSWQRGGCTVAELTIVSDVHCLEVIPCLKFTGFAHGRQIDCHVTLTSRPRHYGGEEWYALCPVTGALCKTLVVAPGQAQVTSVRGSGVPYASTCQSEVDRAMRTIHRIGERQRTMSKYTRKPTRAALHEKWAKAHAVYDEWEERITSRW